MRFVLLAFLLLGSPAVSAPRDAFTVAETGRRYHSLQEAVGAIGDGEGTVVIASGVYRDCAVQTAGDVTYRAAVPGGAIFEREPCEDKAALVLRGRNATVDGLVFRGYRVADGNGAGIRIEEGDLVVRNTMFLDSQIGVVGSKAAAERQPQRVRIEYSTFAGLGQCRESEHCGHGIYLGNTGLVTVSHSRFERGRGGHYLKCRCAHVAITDNSFDDTTGTDTNYMIDLPEGARGIVARNVFVQGRDKENGSALITVSAEMRRYPAGGLRIEDNDARIAPGAESRPVLVANASGETLAIARNRLGTAVRPYAEWKPQY